MYLHMSLSKLSDPLNFDRLRIRFFLGGNASSFSVSVRSPRTSMPEDRLGFRQMQQNCENTAIQGSPPQNLETMLLPFCTMITLSSIGVSLRSSFITLTKLCVKFKFSRDFKSVKVISRLQGSTYFPVLTRQ